MLQVIASTWPVTQFYSLPLRVFEGVFEDHGAKGRVESIAFIYRDRIQGEICWKLNHAVK